MNSKPWYLSKTLWANVLMLVLDLINGTFGIFPIPDNIKIYIALGVNIALRFITGAPIGVGK